MRDEFILNLLCDDLGVDFRKQSLFDFGDLSFIRLNLRVESPARWFWLITTIFISTAVLVCVSQISIRVLDERHTQGKSRSDNDKSNGSSGSFISHHHF